MNLVIYQFEIQLISNFWKFSTLNFQFVFQLNEYTSNFNTWLTSIPTQRRNFSEKQKEQRNASNLMINVRSERADPIRRDHNPHIPNVRSSHLRHPFLHRINLREKKKTETKNKNNYHPTTPRKPTTKIRNDEPQTTPQKTIEKNQKRKTIRRNRDPEPEDEIRGLLPPETATRKPPSSAFVVALPGLDEGGEEICESDWKLLTGSR